MGGSSVSLPDKKLCLTFGRKLYWRTLSKVGSYNWQAKISRQLGFAVSQLTSF